MPNRVLSQVSHVLVHTSSREVAASSKIYAVIQLCFGSDEDFIGQILYAVSVDGSIGYVMPSRESILGNGRHPVFGGTLEQEIRGVTKISLERIKKATGSIAYGKKYRVAGESVTEEEPVFVQ